jgi:hypothetical protein
VGTGAGACGGAIVWEFFKVDCGVVVEVVGVVLVVGVGVVDVDISFGTEE